MKIIRFFESSYKPHCKFSKTQWTMCMRACMRECVSPELGKLQRMCHQHRVLVCVRKSVTSTGWVRVCRMLLAYQTPSVPSPHCCTSNKAKFTPAAPGVEKERGNEKGRGEERGREMANKSKVRRGREEMRGQSEKHQKEEAKTRHEYLRKQQETYRTQSWRRSGARQKNRKEKWSTESIGQIA